jgi:hypothetical protein
MQLLFPIKVKTPKLYSSSRMYEGRSKSSWIGGSAPLLCREAVSITPSCSGGGNVVVA